jgi:DNA uptake protein ComE-like DNA-binding protein
MVLITAMWIIIALSALVLVLCREMVVEAQVTRQHLSQAKADAAEIGVEQLVMAVVEQELIIPGYKDSLQWEQRELGDCYFWVLTYNTADTSETTYAYGMTDEASKIDLNTADITMLQYLPGISRYPNLAAMIVDWRDADDLVTLTDDGSQGAESNEYLAQYGYAAKNARFESAEELKLLLDVDDSILHGLDFNHNGVIDEAELAQGDGSYSFELSKVGMLPFVTTYGVRATNVNTSAAYITTSPITSLNLTDTNGNAITQPIDINNATASAMNGPLQLMLNQVLGSDRANQLRTQTANGKTGMPPQQGQQQGTANIFTSVFDWAIVMQQRAQLTSQEFTTIFPYLTAIPPANPNNSTDSAYTLTGKLNIVTASKPALMCLFEETDADTIIAQRDSMALTVDANGASQVGNIAWLMDLGIAPETLQSVGRYITGSSTIFSADIVTVSKDGRAFKRVKVVVDASSGVPQIVYRKDLTDAGWPIDPSIRERLRKGEPLDGPGATDQSTPGSRLSAGVR